MAQHPGVEGSRSSLPASPGPAPERPLPAIPMEHIYDVLGQTDSPLESIRVELTAYNLARHNANFDNVSRKSVSNDGDADLEEGYTRDRARR